MIRQKDFNSADELASHFKVAAVDQVSFTVPKGSLAVRLGPSGCGKSTILHLIAGLETVTAGSVSIGGRDGTHTDQNKMGVSMVFRSYAGD